RQRSQAFGIAQGGMSLGQGVAIVVAGAAAERYAPNLVIAAGGAAGAGAAGAIAFSRLRARLPVQAGGPSGDGGCPSRFRGSREPFFCLPSGGSWVPGQPQLVPRIAGAPSSDTWVVGDRCRGQPQLVPRIAAAPSS